MSKQRKRRRKARRQNQWMYLAFGAVVVIALAVWGLSGRAGELPAVGKRIADFTVTDVDGQPFQLGEVYKEGEVILVFYRGFF